MSRFLDWLFGRKRAPRIEELDVVRVLRPIPAHGIETGETATVHFIFTGPDGRRVLELEFSDDSGRLVAMVSSFPEEDVELVWSAQRRRR